MSGGDTDIAPQSVPARTPGLESKSTGGTGGGATTSEHPWISVVIPVYRAEECLWELHRRLTASLQALATSYEIVLVEDGSPDGSWRVIREITATDSRVRGIQLSRNFGQHLAITAGLDHSRGEWTVIMDCDLQDQPEEIHKLLVEAQIGYDVVVGRRSGRRNTWTRRLASHLYYIPLNWLTGLHLDKRVSGFCILSRKAVHSIISMRESTRFLMAMVHHVGFRRSSVDVVHAERYRGESSYTLFGLFTLALDTAVAFSNKPLSLTIAFGATLSGLALACALFVYVLALRNGTSVPGWASLMVSMWFLAGLTIGILGMLGVYLGKVFNQTRNRPLYFIQEEIDARKERMAVAPQEVSPASQIASSPGWVIWITGLAGAGKTSVSREVDRRIRQLTAGVIRLDGDSFRSMLGNDLGYNMKDRLENARRICRVAQHLSSQGCHVVVATISLFRECHEWNRANMPRYCEVLLEASGQTLRSRNQKGLYEPQVEAEVTNVVGVDQPYDLPDSPHLVIDNNGSRTVAEAAQRIFDHLGDLGSPRTGG